MKWVGFSLIAVALIGLPIAIWISGRWSLVFATLGTVGIVVLGAASRRRPPADDEKET